MAENLPAPDRAVEAGRGALFIGAAKISFMVVGFAQKTLLTRVIGSVDYGAFAVVNNAVSLVNNATVQGTIQSVSKFTAEDDSSAEAVKAAGLRLQFVVGAILGLIFFLGAPFAARFYHQDEFARWFRIVALIPFLYSLYSVFVGSANGLRRFRAQAGFDMGFSLLKTVLLLGGAALLGVTGAFSGFAAAAGVILVVSALVMGLPRPGVARFRVGRLVGFMAWIVVYTILINTALNYDSLLLRKFADLAAPTALANQVTAYYEAVRTLALLPYQALLTATFIIFPLVTRSTLQQDRAATRAYVTQTLRYALIFAVAMAVVLAARPQGLLETINPKEYGAGAGALPILVCGIVCLSLLGVTGTIINASGRPAVAIGLVAITLVVGLTAALVLVRGSAPGPAMLEGAATATSLGMLAGLIGALVYVRRAFQAGLPLGTVVRVVAAAAAAALVGHFVPGHGKIVTLAVLAIVGVVYLVALIVLGEFGREDRAKFAKILRR
jgi:stage V sporulation protein B